MKTHTVRRLLFALTFIALLSYIVIPLVTSAQNVVQIPCAPIPSGIVSWWPAEGDGSDIIGPNNGVLNGAAANAVGKVGQAFSFTGVGDFVDIQDSPSLDSTSSTISVEGWINPQVPNTDRGYIFARRDPYVTESFSVHIDPQARIGVILRTTNSPDEHGAFFVSAPGIIQFGQWQHLAVTLNTDSGLLKAYINGQLTPLAVLEGPAGFSGPMVNADHTFIGQRQSQTDPGGTEGATGAAYFKGLIDELAIYSVELTQSDIATIYFADDIGKCRPTPTPTPTPTPIPTPSPSPTPTPGPRPNLSLNVVAPQSLTLINGQYSPNPFNVVATVRNNGNARANGVVITITLPPDLTLTTATPFISLGNLLPGQERQGSWQVRVGSQASGTLSYSVRAAASNADPKTVQKQLDLPVASLPLERRPPYDFFNGCNASNELGNSAGIVRSDPRTGFLSVNVKATGTGSTTARAGSGIVFRPNFSGSIRIKADIQLRRSSLDIVSALSLPFFPGSQVAGSTIDSDVFIRTSSSTTSPLMTIARFQSASANAGFPSVFGNFYSLRRYDSSPTYSVEFTTPAVTGQPLSICAGVQSRATSVGLYPFLVFSNGLYDADLVRISLVRQ